MAYELKKDINSPGVPIFATYDEFKVIAKEVLSIYEDLKREFLIVTS